MAWNERGDYMEKVSARANGLKNPQKVHVIEIECQPGLKRQRELTQCGCF